MDKGPLVKVKIGPGRYAKMHRQDAIEAGLLKPKKKKRRKPAKDKMRRPGADKSGRKDDLTAISGDGR